VRGTGIAVGLNGEAVAVKAEIEQAVA